MSQKLDTRTRIVEIATDLIRSRSYHSFSFKDIAEEIGIKKASIYYHFESKAVLGVQVVRNYKSKIDYLVNRLDQTTDDPWLQLEAYFKFFRDGSKNDLICPGGVLTIEYNALPKIVQEEITKLFDFYIEWLSDLLETGKNEGAFHFNESSNNKALYISSTIEGALLYGRLYKSEEHFDTVIEQIKNSIR